jgi:2-polyprenyl-6-methoxyphenol hydroxylase-like FAD-dependent oxidoreductase
VHPGAADYNWVKYAIFPADDGTFSITLAAPLAFPEMKMLSRAAAFDEVARSLPAVAAWVDPARAEPIGDPRHPVQSMGGLFNRLRRFVDDAGPLALGFFALGDAASCTNPLYGRGCSLGFLHAELLGAALDRHPRDLRAAALALDAAERREVEPFYRASVIADRDAQRKAEGRTSAKLSARLQQRFFEEGVGTAVRCDPVVYRAFVRMMNMLETPEEAFGRPSVVLRSLWMLLRGKRFRSRFALPDPPDRDALLARCAALLAREARPAMVD